MMINVMLVTSHDFFVSSYFEAVIWSWKPQMVITQKFILNMKSHKILLIEK